MNRRLNMVSPPQSLSRIGDIEGDLLLSTMHNQEREGTRKSHFLKNVTLSCPTGGMLVRSACHWLTHNFQNHSLPLIGWHSLLLILFSHQPRPAAAVHWTCSVATWIVRLSGTNFPSHFVPNFKSVMMLMSDVSSDHCPPRRHFTECQNYTKLLRVY